MTDKTHWLQNPNKNFLGHWDIPESGEMMVTIESAKWEEVVNPIVNTTEAKRVIRFKEDIKPMICNQTNAQSILNSTGIKFMEDSEGCVVYLFVTNIIDKRTKENVDCIRIRSKPSISLEDVKLMYKEKAILVSEEDTVFVERVINNKDAKLYNRVHGFLSKLK
ncbi:MAG: hypothetical protein ACI9JN_001267 [Bacteroidia bacterium]|jgi:hypothetical protein